MEPMEPMEHMGHMERTERMEELRGKDQLEAEEGIPTPRIHSIKWCHINISIHPMLP